MEENSGQIEFKILRSYIKGLLVVSLIITSIFIYAVSVQSHLVILEKIPLCFIPILISSIYLLNLVKYKVVVNNKNISIKSLFNNKTTRLGLLGNHSFESGITIKTTYKEDFVISPPLEQQALFLEWLSHHSQNPEQEKEIQLHNSLKEKLESNPSFGKNDVEKAANWKKAKTVTYVLNGVAMFIFFLNFYSIVFTKDNYYPVLLSILLPFLSLYALHYFKGLIVVGFNPEKLKVHPNLRLPFGMSIAGVLSYLLYSGYLLNGSQLLLYAFFLAIVLTALFLMVIKEVDFKKIKEILFAILMLMCGCFAYSYGTLSFLNEYKDSSALQEFNVEVLEKRFTNQKNSIYYISLAPWYTNIAKEEIEVKEWLYHSIERKDSVRIFLSQGNLGVEWYWIEK